MRRFLDALDFALLMALIPLGFVLLILLLSRAGF